MTNDSTPRQSHLAFLDTVRAYELDIARSYLPAGSTDGVRCRLLEVGAGTGAQAKRLSELGYAVSALDVKESSYHKVRCFKITEYDGINIPFPSSSHDVVFSSHVLEHIVHLDEVLQEMHRVLSDDGICVHLVPTSSCRAWSLAAHYIWLIRRIIQRLMISHSATSDMTDAPRTPTTALAWFWTLFPPRHGERGNTVTEVYYYSRHFWQSKFEKNNFHIIHMDSNNLFYTMANAVGSTVNVKNRRLLARIFGSACHIYVLKKDLN
jgi:SAM-dependent methyltransferase